MNTKQKRGQSAHTHLKCILSTGASIKSAKHSMLRTCWSWAPPSITGSDAFVWTFSCKPGIKDTTEDEYRHLVYGCLESIYTVAGNYISIKEYIKTHQKFTNIYKIHIYWIFSSFYFIWSLVWSVGYNSHFIKGYDYWGHHGTPQRQRNSQTVLRFCSHRTRTCGLKCHRNIMLYQTCHQEHTQWALLSAEQLGNLRDRYLAACIRH